MIVDTNALSAWLDGDPAIESRLASAPLLVMSVIVMGEYRFGISFSKYRVEYERRVSLIEIDFPLLGAGGETAIHYAAIRKELQGSWNANPMARCVDSGAIQRTCNAGAESGCSF